MEKFVFLEHTADIKFQAFGEGLEEALENSVLALKQAMYGKTKVKNSKTKIVNVKGKDYESMLYNFLEEIIYFVDKGEFIVDKVKTIRVDGFKISAVLSGDKPQNYNFTNNIKAVTYNEMFVKKQQDKWVCQVVLDA